MSLQELNMLAQPALQEALAKCCGATRWVQEFSRCHPFRDEKTLFEKAREIWFDQCQKEDWLEAFTHHPKIGDLESLAKKYAATKDWAGSEQSGVQSASPQTLLALATGNEVYEQKFGHIFIVCATGKSAVEMLDLLTQRLQNDPHTELLIAMQEQHKITEIRLRKLLATDDKDSTAG